MEFNQKQIQILDTAEKLFALQGFHGASVRDIAQDADVNIAMISYYFGSKEKLIESIFLRRIYDVRTSLEELLSNETLLPENKIDRLIELFVAKISERPYFCRIMVRAQVTQESVVTDLIQENKQVMYEMIRKLIREGQQKGSFTGDVDVLMMVNTLVGTTNHAIASQQMIRKVMKLESMPDEEFRLHLRTELSTHLKKMFKAVLTK